MKAVPPVTSGRSVIVHEGQHLTRGLQIEYRSLLRWAKKRPDKQNWSDLIEILSQRRCQRNRAFRARFGSGFEAQCLTVEVIIIKRTEMIPGLSTRFISLNMSWGRWNNWNIAGTTTKSK